LSDGKRVAFQGGNERAIYRQGFEGGRAERLTTPGEGEQHVPQAWSSDGTYLLFTIVKRAESSTADRALRPLISTLWTLASDSKKVERFDTPAGGDIRGASFSPDGRFVAYALEFGGGPRNPNGGVFVEPFPATGQRWQAPRQQRDFHPVWTRDGKSLLFIPAATRIASMPVTTRPTFQFGAPVELTRAPRPDLPGNEPRGYDVLPDGRIVSLVTAFDDGPSVSGTGGVRVVINWFDELKRLVPSR
jgi:Tol biopolymer transport system component